MPITNTLDNVTITLNTSQREMITRALRAMNDPECDKLLFMFNHLNEMIFIHPNEIIEIATN